MIALRRAWIPARTARFAAVPARTFRASPVASVKVGDAIPDVELVESSPGNKVSIARELKGKGLIIGVPAAFSPSCSERHVPGYINSTRLKDAGKVFVVSVNDPFVMKAWAASLDADGKSGVSCHEGHSRSGRSCQPF